MAVEATEATALRVESGEDFVVTPHIENICQRAQAYLEANYPVHFSGPAGTGKTTLALRLAGSLGRPVMLIYGDEEFGTSDLLGGQKGITSSRNVDNFIHSVLKTQESVKSMWVDERLTIACKNGYTLVYDEFSRSHAEANNALLSILEEGLLALPEGSQGGQRSNYVRVHPEFRAIFTSNPDEYAGVYTPASALLDRMVTIKLGHYDHETEVAIAQAKSGATLQDVQKIVDIVRTARKDDSAISVRASIMISQLMQHRQGLVAPHDPILAETCMDVLGLGLSTNGKVQQIIEAGLNSKTTAGEPK